MEPRLRRQLERVDTRLTRVRREQASAVAWALLATVALALLVTGLGLDGDVVVGMLVAAAVCVLGTRWIAARRHRGVMAAARVVESRHPELDSALLAAAELEPDLPGDQYGFLAKRLVDQVLRQPALSPARVVSDARVRRAYLMHGVFAALFAGAVIFLRVPSLGSGLGSVFGGGADPGLLEVLVEPGDAAVEKGRGLLITAQFAGARVPADVDLVFTTDEGEPERVPMKRSLDDPVFGARLASIVDDTMYRIEWEGAASDSFRLAVFEHPELVRSDVVLHYPAYAGIEERRIEDTRRVTVPEGTELTLICRLNKVVASAVLIDETLGMETVLEQDSAAPLEYGATLHMTESVRLALSLVDEESRPNRTRTEFVFKVTPNRRPDLKLTSARDTRVSALEELTLNAKMTDDFGVQRFGVSYRIGGDDETEVVLGQGQEDAQLVDAEHTIALEDLGASPAQLLSYHFWADDLDTAGGPRRTTSDLYFAEVRPFEEIFRQAEPQPGGDSAGDQGQQGGDQQQQGGPQGAGELVELQRDVILATWNVFRRDADGVGDLVEEAEVVRDAQRDAKDQLTELAANPSTLR